MLLLLLRMKREIQLLLYLTKSNYAMVVSDIEMVKPENDGNDVLSNVL